MNVDLYEYYTWRQKNKKVAYEERVFIDDQRIDEISHRPVLTPGKDAYWSPGKDPYLSVFKLSKTTNSFKAPSLNGNGFIDVQIEQEEFLEEGYEYDEFIEVDTEGDV